MRTGVGWTCEIKWPLSRQQKKNGAMECILVHEDKSSIKFGLLPWKGNKLKWHSTQIFCNSLLTTFIHTAFRKCLQLDRNIHSKWVTHRFQHFSNSAKGGFGIAILTTFTVYKVFILTELQLCLQSNNIYSYDVLNLTTCTVIVCFTPAINFHSEIRDRHKELMFRVQSFVV